jgi:glutamate-1-semialdehyde 2,1-aminomutase
VQQINEPDSGQHQVDRAPIVEEHAAGSRMIDVDDNEYVDYDMGFGALFAGHMHPAVRAAVEAQLDAGTLYVTPCELDTEVAELLADRYGLPMWRPTNSGTEATMDAIRVARGATGRDKIVKVEGGYHGHHDEVMISNTPALADAGPAEAPFSVPQSGGITQGTIDDVIVIPYNDADALDRALAGGEVACFIVEPVMENIGICLPAPGYLEAVREITHRHGTLLIFDEVKTGITAGYGGASKLLGVEPDLVTLAKSIGGGFPVGAFGGKADYMGLITTGEVLHLGTYNGNPLVMAAVKATLRDACTPDAVAATVARNRRLVTACQEVIDRSGVPAHTVEFGAKGCITWSTTPVRNYRDYKATDFDLAFAQWIHGINRGVLLPPGLDEQWLISLMHDEADAMKYADVFAEFVDELTA